MKFTFIGAGSLDFTKDLVRDILTFDAFKDAELMLMDINPKRLEYAIKGVQKIIDAGKYPATVHGTLNRREALKDADRISRSRRNMEWISASVIPGDRPESSGF